ncbi:type VII secretion system-associated protein (plasmid) [Streptomyces scopuliridis]|uniref:Type VII secretion system-associated protein n=1 Tax=Streptomyces scopuliridis TaxID=452529 RepID=A0ACD4ZZ31_9ACTN|nr:type VII secretion system-associated protein [Streptomyces scopuliridis]WSC03499.1 type VII secretion system-associated protein [Streptomyces scopuliridis]WSC11356.1 type VII secretion system-associated protein [Streptomyces scopuliridis]
MADFSQLDKASIQAFLDQDLSAFIADIKSVIEGDPSMRDMADGVTTPDNVTGIGKGKPLMMGLIDDDDLVSGASFTDALASNMQTVVATLEGQQSTFDEIEDGLRQTLEELFKTQGDNLGTIEADTFTDVLSDSGFSGETSVPEPDDSSDDEDSTEDT